MDSDPSAVKPPPLTDDLLRDDDDELFVSAIDQTPKGLDLSVADGDNTIMSSPMEDLDGSEIDLNATEPDDDRVLSADPTGSLSTPTGLESPPAQNVHTNGFGTSDSLAADDASSDVAFLPATMERNLTIDSTPIPAPVAQFTATSTHQQLTVLPEETECPIAITVGEPKKVGDGYGAYVVYKVSTKTALGFFKKREFSVTRRFSDFRGLRDKLAEKHQIAGRIIPPAPEKDAIATAKVKVAKEEEFAADTFIEKRRYSLERYLNRTAAHSSLRADPDFREFLELEADLPRATSSSALSGAGVKRFFNMFGDTVNKMKFRMEETDPWFDDKQNQIENLDIQLRKLLASVEALIHHRRELATSTGQFAKSCAMLGNCEEHTSLSCALSQLADTEEKVESVYTNQVNNDFIYLNELIRDYINMIGAVKDVFGQRVKVYQGWQYGQQQLVKRREKKARAELEHRPERVAQAMEEIAEWEGKVNRSKEEFDSISKNIKLELERFELSRVKDFRDSIIKYMESLLESQHQLIKHWEGFLPGAKAIS